MNSGRLYVVATPIGNLSDMTFRALEALKACDLIACEDTRQTLKLLNHYGIQKPLFTIFGPREKREAGRVLKSLEQGKSVALVTDAGTPALSDPGNEIVRQVRRSGFPVEPVPGPSAPAALASVSGAADQGFIFLGFLPRKKSKIKRELERFAGLELPVIFFESPFRVVQTLQAAGNVFGNGAFCLVGREMTKKFEETISGSIADVLGKISGRENLGEFTILIKPS